jgi:peptidoglycan/LPS O-acetylase OafA/YrhL
LYPDHWNQLFLFLIFFMDSSKATFQEINVPYWSLAVEMQFYLLLPLISLGIYLFVRRIAHQPRERLITAISMCVTIILLGLVIRYYSLQFMQQSSPHIPPFAAGIFFFVFGIWGKYWEDFAVGMIVCLCFMYTQHPTHGGRLQHKLKQASTSFAIVTVALLTFCAIWNFRTSYPIQTFDLWLPLVPYRLWLLDICTSVAWGLLIMTLLFGKKLFSMPFEWKPTRRLGTISYGIYLWHMPMLTLFKKYVFSHLYVNDSVLSHLLYWTWFWLVIIPWCILVYWLVERPFIRLKDRPTTLKADTNNVK